jgi:hypothetical protein
VTNEVLQAGAEKGEGLNMTRIRERMKILKRISVLLGCPEQKIQHHHDKY